jgi:hypothetical protein
MNRSEIESALLRDTMRVDDRPQADITKCFACGARQYRPFPIAPGTRVAALGIAALERHRARVRAAKSFHWARRP